MTPEQLKLAKDYLSDARAYASGILSGDIVACHWVKAAVRRDEDDRMNGSARGLYFDEIAAARVLIFISMLSHYKGEWRGQRIVLEPWQSWIISTVFGWKKADGTRRFIQVYEEVARKNGKTIKLAGIGGYGLMKDGEGSPEIYAAATTRDQAKRLWEDAHKMLRYATAIGKRLKFTPSKSRIEYAANDGFFVPLSRDSETIDGTNPHFAMVDELHAHKTPEIYEVLESGQGARSQPIIWAITTAGFSDAGDDGESICLQKRRYATDLLDGKIKDDSFFGIIYTLDNWQEEWDKPECWIKANPNLEYCAQVSPDGTKLMRGSVKASYLATRVIVANNSPTARLGILTKNFNIWMQSATSWLNMDKWAQCKQEFDLSIFKKADKLYAGLDLASISDLCSFVLLGVMPDGTIKVWHRSWVPESQVSIAIKERKIPYDVWIQQGFLRVTSGDATDYEFILDDLVGDHWRNANPDAFVAAGMLEGLQITNFGFDRWNSHWLTNKLKELGVNMLGYGMGYKDMSPAMKAVEHDYLSGNLHHSDDPLLTWSLGNVVATLDPVLNVKPDKKLSKNKIDPAVALFIARGVSLNELPVLRSAYEDEVYI